jgi:hypothetical protein
VRIPYHLGTLCDPEESTIVTATFLRCGLLATGLYLTHEFTKSLLRLQD